MWSELSSHSLKRKRKSIFDHAEAWGAFEPENLTETLIEIGRTTGEFDESDAMVLTGRIVVILSYRRRPHAVPEMGLHCVVLQVLNLAGFEASAHLYGKLHQNGELNMDSNSLPFVKNDRGELEIFDTERMVARLIALGNQTKEFGECEAMVMTGTCVNLLQHWPMGKVITAMELREMVENLLIDKGYIKSARRLVPDAISGPKTLPLVDAVGTFLTTIEGFLSVKGFT